MSALHPRTRLFLLLALAATGLAFSACDVRVRKDANGQDKNVDINTPVGGIHVSNDVDVRDTGLPVYPGARLQEKSGNDDKQANVNISTGFFGLKVVALEYESDDAPEKLSTYYKAQLKKYGDVLECHTHKHGPTLEVKESNKDDDSKLLTCEDSGGETLELKAGTKDNQRLVSIEPSGKGTHFALVRILMRGKDTI